VKIPAAVARQVAITIFKGIALFVKHADSLLLKIGIKDDVPFREDADNWMSDPDNWKGPNSVIPIEWWDPLKKFFAGKATPEATADDLLKIGMRLVEENKKKKDPPKEPMKKTDKEGTSIERRDSE